MKRYAIRITKRYKKGHAVLMRSGFDIKKLEIAIDLLASGANLPSRYYDHELKGKLKGTRECHIAPDCLLRYAKDDEYLILFLIDAGTHRRVLSIE
jgi:mRNA interferase YafQ